MPILRGRDLDKLIEPYHLAFEQAEFGYQEGGIPDGAALVRGGSLVATGRNRRVPEGDITAHGIVDCLRAAGSQDEYADTVLYATRPPCRVCAEAILERAIPVVVVGDDSLFAGEIGLLNSRGTKTLILEDSKTRKLVAEFARRHPEVWAQDTAAV
jgi:creatinine deaminase